MSTFDAAGQIPTVYSWSFGIQRELGAQTSLDASYIGNMGRHLQYRRDLNQLELGTTLQPGVLASVNNTQNALRPYKGYLGIPFTEFGAVSNYNAFQGRISRRFGRGFTGNFNYTWSKAMGEVDGDGTAIGYFKDRRREYGLAGFDRLHVVTIDYVYELPQVIKSANPARWVLNGWQLNGITRFWTGPPANITANGGLGTLGGGQRANYLGGELYPDEQTPPEFLQCVCVWTSGGG